jgi:hypothetical protein
VTIGAAWIRAGVESDELWLATDSRLSGDGYIWDDCPKLMPLPRRDAVIGFSGSTEQGYPLMLQIATAVGAYRAALDGNLEFFRLAAHLERVVNSMMSRLKIDPAVRGAAPNRREFASRGDVLILGGYSRRWGRMALRALEYNGGARAWLFAPVRAEFGEGRVLRAFGDSPSRGRFLYYLRTLLAERGTLGDSGGFQLEPLEVIAAMLQMPESSERRLPRDRRPRTIGGFPQVVRVVPGAHCTRWRFAGDKPQRLPTTYSAAAPSHMSDSICRWSPLMKRGCTSMLPASGNSSMRG